ncbi:hypothetical protein [Phormidesmis sp. 146-33]
MKLLLLERWRSDQPQVRRKVCNADTLLYLVAAVGCKIQLTCMEIEEL